MRRDRPRAAARPPRRLRAPARCATSTSSTGSTCTSTGRHARGARLDVARVRPCASCAQRRVELAEVRRCTRSSRARRSPCPATGWRRGRPRPGRRRPAPRAAAPAAGRRRRGRAPDRSRRPTPARARAAHDEVKAAVRSLSELAPLHNAAGLEGVAVAEERCADVPQVAVFDTAFHAGLSAAARTYACPHEWRERGAAPLRLPRDQPRVRGTARRAPARRPLGELRLITCHLGSGARWRRSATAAASTRRWASRRSRAW